MDSDQGKLFVGGISWETTEGMLKDYFGVYGEVAESVVMRDKVTGRARGFGFVVFADPAVADRVLQEKHTIDGRVVEAKAAAPRGEQQNFARSNSSNPMSGGQIRTKKIFVGGLAPTVTEDEFRRYFEQFGRITDVVVMYDHNTQRPRGFGFITYDSEDAVDKVLQKSFHELNDKMVEVKRAVPRELSAGPIGGRSGASGFGAAAGRGAYGQGYSSNPGNAYGSHVDSGYGPPAPAAAGRGSYPAYGPGGYGAGGGYGGDMNGGYGAGSFGGGAMYGTAGAYGTTGYATAPAGTGFGGASGYGSGVPSVGYGSAPVGPRSPWGSSGTGFPSGGSPVGYGATGGAGMAGYGSAGWGSGATGQPTGGSAGSGYGSGGYGNVGGGGATGYGDAYGGSGYGDPAWRSVADLHSSPAGGSVPLASGGYVLDSGGAPDGTVNGPSNYGSGYGTAGRHSQLSSDTRFRPYPGTGERSI